MNNLAQLLEQYDRLGLGGAPNVHGDSPWSGSFSRDTDAAARNSARNAWAMAQMRDQGQNGGTQERMPDYFGEAPYQAPMYREPQQSGQQQYAHGEGPGWRGGQYVGRNSRGGDGFTMGGPSQPSQQDQIRNYLAALLKQGR